MSLAPLKAVIVRCELMVQNRGYEYIFVIIVLLILMKEEIKMLND
jgi:hypothetical protein